MKINEQVSDRFWRDDPLVGGQPNLSRYHRLHLVETGDLSPALLLGIYGRANDAEYAGIARGHLFCENVKANRFDDRWEIEVLLKESTVSRLEPAKLLTGDGEVIQLQIPLHSATPFFPCLPLGPPFPPAEGQTFAEPTEDSRTVTA